MTRSTAAPRRRSWLLRAAVPVTRGGPVVVPAALVSTYLWAETPVWVAAAALTVIAIVAGAYQVASDRERALVTWIVLAAFLPALAGWSLVTPVVGAVLLVTVNLVHRPWRSRFTAKPTAIVLGASVVAIAGVAVFQVVSALVQSASATITWVTLPGHEDRPVVVVLLVLGASAINATFEELLWRTALPGLFPNQRWLAPQWVLLAVCFGASHVHGTPGGILGMGFAAVFGFAMFIIRDLSRGSVVWIIAVHFIADVILIGGLYGIYSQ